LGIETKSSTINLKAIEEGQIPMQESPVEQFRKLSASISPEARERYIAICNQRDAVLTHAVLAAAKHLLSESKYQADPQLTPNQNNQAAIKSLEEYLADSSISEMDQYLLALIGTGALYGWGFRQALEEESPQIYEFYRIDSNELDPMIIHRLARAIDRSMNHTALLQRFISDELVKLPHEDAELIAVAIQMLLTETPASDLEEDFGRIVLDSILGG
jgi:hypothetical protein